jgi:hypothetical protein
MLMSITVLQCTPDGANADRTDIRTFVGLYRRVCKVSLRAPLRFKLSPILRPVIVVYCREGGVEQLTARFIRWYIKDGAC